MKTRHILPALLVAGASVGLLPGCYTQLATYQDDEPSYSDQQYGYEQEYPDSDAYDASSSFSYPRSRVWLSFSYGYPDWYYYPPYYVYDPYYWSPYSYTVIYPSPWWWDYPYYGYGYNSWYAHRPFYYNYGSPYYTYGSGVSSTTRNSGVRRSGTERRRDSDPGRAAGVSRTGAAATAAGAASPGVSGRSATGSRTPSVDFTRPRSGSTQGRSAPSGTRSSTTRRNSSVLDIISRSISRDNDSRGDGYTPSSSSGRSGQSARPAERSSGSPSYSQPSSGASRSSSAARSSSSGSRSSGSSRSGDSGRRR